MHRLLPFRRDRGQALVELALVAPIVLLLLLGAVDLGRVWNAQTTLENAAREGAMEGIFEPGSFIAGQGCTSANKDNNRIMCRVMNEVRDSGVTVLPADVARSCTPSCAAGTVGTPSTVTVTVRGGFSFFTPLVALFTGGQTITLGAEASSTIAMSPPAGSVATPTPSPTATPSPVPTPTPTPGATATPSPTASATPTPTPPPCVAPVAAFSVTPTSGKRNTTVFTFTDASTNMSNSTCNPIWSWNFGDGSGVTSAQNPTHVYTKKGTYTVELVVSNTMGTDAETVTINVSN